jgi:hypothetical protein
MRAVVYERHGGPEELEHKEVPDPTPGEDEVLVEVEAVGVNYRDVYEREGRSYALEPPAESGIGSRGPRSRAATRSGSPRHATGWYRCRTASRPRQQPRRYFRA